MKTIEDRLAELEQRCHDLEVRMFNTEKAVPPKKRKWSEDEDRFLVHLAQNCNLTKDEMRSRTTKYLTLVMAFQKKNERTERAITMRLDYKYFG